MPSTPLYAFPGLKLEPAMRPDSASTIAVLLNASETYTHGEILGELLASPGVYVKYNSAGQDGSQVPKALMVYDVVADSAGKPTGMTFPYPPFPDLSVPAYSNGYFDVATINDAMGDDGTLLAAALATAGFGALVQGTTAAGIVRLGA